MSPMIPTYRYSISSSPMPLDLNEDHHSYQHLFNTTNQASSPSSSISYSTLFNPDQNQAGSSSNYLESNHTQSNEKVTIIYSILYTTPFITKYN